MARATLTGEFPVHYPLMIKTTVVVAAMLLGFLSGVPIARVAIAGAAYTLLTRRVRPEKVYREVNWELLVLFTGLFVVIGGVEASGIAEQIVAFTEAANKPLIPSFAEPTRGWLLLGMASTLAGNLTLVGSVANLIVAELAREGRVRIGFVEYCRVGVPLTVVTLLLGWALLSAP
jgi:Na+/H+ antiporter NhaD/arsenite permease-like protein